MLIVFARHLTLLKIWKHGGLESNHVPGDLIFDIVTLETPVEESSKCSDTTNSVYLLTRAFTEHVGSHRRVPIGF